MTALVTGGAGAIGSAIAFRMASDGHAVAVVDLDGEGAESVAARIRGDGGSALGVRCDLSDASQIEHAFDLAISRVRPP